MLRVLTGDVFGWWTVIEYRPVASLCRCRCDFERTLRNAMLVNGGSTKCKKCTAVNRRGVGKELDINIYYRLSVMVDNAISRCTDPTHERWKYYGGRGIEVWQDWLNNKKEFIKYLSELPSADNRELILDREDNERGYEPGNLRFVSRSISGKNRRRFGHLLEHSSDGKFTTK